MLIKSAAVVRIAESDYNYS